MKKKSQSKLVEDKPSCEPKSFSLHCFEAAFASITIVTSFILIAYSMYFLRFIVRQLSNLFSFCFSCLF
jgi:hypothetical protein